MTRAAFFIAIAAFLTVGCTTRQDVLNARLDLEASRDDLRDARAFGDRRDVAVAREHEARARQRLKRKRQQYQDDNACGPLYLARCPD